MQKLADKTIDGVMMLKDLEIVVEVLGTAGDWYPGGVTELKVNIIGSISSDIWYADTKYRCVLPVVGVRAFLLLSN